MLDYSYISESGSLSVNEDSTACMSVSDKYCFVICDGLGGHGKGDLASSLVTDVFRKKFYQCDDIPSFLDDAFSSAQAELISEQKKLNSVYAAKTTCAACITDKKNVYIGHVGDSRVYVFSGNRIRYRTTDHSVPQMLVISREIREDEIRFHPDRNKLLRALGDRWERPMYELRPKDRLKKCQAFLLCTDGFWELINETDMCDTLKRSSDSEEWLSMMTEIVEKNGKVRKMDNYSAIAVCNYLQRGI